MRVRIEDRNSDGRGRGRGAKRVVLVSQAHPGEEVTVRTDLVTRGTVQGRVAKLLERDSARIAHECRHEFHCTGCPLLAASGEDEAVFKTARLAHALESLHGYGLPRPEPLLRPGPLFGYRHLAKQVFGERGGRVVLGSFVAGTHRVTDNAGCPVLAAALRDLTDAVARLADESGLPLHAPNGRPGLRHVVARLSRTSGRMLLLIGTTEDPPDGASELGARLRRECPDLAGVHVLVQSRSGNALLAGEVRWRSGADFVEDEILGFRHRIGPRSFFQIHPAAAEVMFGIAVEATGEGERCLEVFSGVGALTLPLAARFREVVAIESSAEAATSLRETSSRVGETSGRIVVREGRAEEHVPDALRAAAPDVVVLDPPRAGASPAVMEPIAASGARRCILIACEPDALARDLAPLLRCGWVVERIVPIDQFPRTAHVETIAVVGRR